MTTALLLIDVQKNMLEPPRPVPAHVDVKRALELLLAKARTSGIFVVHVQNDGPPGDPDEPHTPGWDLFFAVAPDELVVRKTVPDAFTNAALGTHLDARKVNQVVVAGMQSNYCVSATCRGALKHGLDVILASGAHATYDEGERAEIISSRVEDEVAKDGVRVISVDKVGF